MTKQTRRIARLRGLSWLNPRNACKCCVLFALSTLALQLPSSAQAQGNLVDMYNWSNQTGYVPNPSNFVAIDSYNSAYFYSGFTTNPLNEGPLFVEPVLTGTLDTTPGDTYDVSFTLQLNAPFDAFAEASFSFDGFTADCDVENPANGDNPGYNPPVTFNYTTVATAQTTPMTFYADFGDYTDELSISDVTVTQVPEVSSLRLLCFGGFLLVVAKRLRGLVKKQKFVFNR